MPKYFKTLCCGCVAVAFIFSIYLKPGLYNVNKLGTCVRGHLVMPHTKYQSSRLCGVREEFFFKEFSFRCNGNHPFSWNITIWIFFMGDQIRTIFASFPISGFSKEDVLSKLLTHDGRRTTHDGRRRTTDTSLSQKAHLGTLCQVS